MGTQSAGSRMSEAVCLALYSTMNATLQLYRDLLAPWGLSYQQLMVLGVLWEEGESTPGRIAQVLGIDSSSVAGLLRRLQGEELIARETDPGDRRRVRVTPTDRGRRIAEELGWLEACVTEAMSMEASVAHDLVTRLDALRQTVLAFPRPQLTPDPAPA